MPEGGDAMQDKSPNPCCASVEKKYSKLLEKYSKLEGGRNLLRKGISILNEKVDAIVKENENMKRELEDAKSETNRWKDEKEQESASRLSLEREVSALKAEIQLLQQKSTSVAQEADGQLRERLNVAGAEVNRLKELLNNERVRANLEKKNADIERKKAGEALKEVKAGQRKASEVQKVANKERKRAEDNRLLWEKFKIETNEIKSMLALEKSKSETVEKKLEAEKLNTIKERKRADLAMVKAEEQRELAEMNLNKAMIEKGRADDLNQKLEEERHRADKLEKAMGECLCSENLVEAPFKPSNRQVTANNAELKSDVCLGTEHREALLTQWVEKILAEKEKNIIREKMCADSEMKKGKKQREVAEALNRKAMEEKNRASHLSRESQNHNLRLEELQKEFRGLVSCRKIDNNNLLRSYDVNSETTTVKLLKKQLKLEKMLVKHAKKMTKVEVARNNLLHQELIRLKQGCLKFQQGLDMRNNCFLCNGEGIHELEKTGDWTITRETFCSDEHHRKFGGKTALIGKPNSSGGSAVEGYKPLKQNMRGAAPLLPVYVPGINSGMEPPDRGSNQKMLQTSTITSNLASFSDRPLVGSQERGAFSVTSSAKTGVDKSNLESTVSRLSDETKIRYNEKAPTKADNSNESPMKCNAVERRVGHRDKRRILDAVGSIKNLHSKGQKLHQRVAEELSVVHGMLCGQKDERTQKNLSENSCRKCFRPSKRWKTSCEEMMAIYPLHEAGVPKVLDASYIQDSDVGLFASPPVCSAMKFDQCPKDRMANVSVSNQCIPQNFDELAINDCMKLLDLDNASDEKSYRTAIATPLSPTLPEIKFQEDEAREAHKPEMLVGKGFLDGLSYAKTLSSLVSNGPASSRFAAKENSVDHFHQIEVLSGNLEMPDVASSEDKSSKILSESRIAPTCSDLLKYYIVFSGNKDSHSISKIIHVISSCMKCPLLHSAEIYLRTILLALLKAEDLSSKEKASALFSLILLKIYKGKKRSLANALSDDLVQSCGSFTLQIRAALSDLVLRKLFMEQFVLLELLALIEDFLLQKRVLVCGDVSAESQVICSKINIVLNGNVLLLSEQAATYHLLVSGGSLLASLCVAIDQIEFVCETSCNIFSMQKIDPSLVLAVLHVFAHICGSKYFALQQYSLAMTVVKSLVRFLEKHNHSNSTSSFSSLHGTPSNIWSCNDNCPFSEGAVSLEGVVFLLLEKLQKYGQSISWPQDGLALVNSLVPRVWSHKDRPEGVFGLTEAVGTDMADENLCQFIDILSLVEIIAPFMSCDWIFDNIIGQLCKFLESCIGEHFSAAIVILLGQLGRLGVRANGYDDIGVEKLRGWLSFFLTSQSTLRKLNFPVQVATVTALFGLTPIKFEELVESEANIPAISSQSIPANFIRQWFFLLSNEQKTFLRLHQAANETDHRTGVSPRQVCFGSTE